MLRKALLAGAVAALTTFGGLGAANAAPVLGSHVDNLVFSAAIGSTAGWAYVTSATGAFTAPGEAEIVLRNDGYANSFGYSRADYTDLVDVFSSGAAVGSTAAVTGHAPSYLFYFSAQTSVGHIDGNMQWTDGASSGGVYGSSQGDIDIFLNAATQTWAFFFDEGAPSGAGDDNDYDDLVITFRQPLPEPAAVGLFGLGMIALAARARRKQA